LTVLEDGPYTIADRWHDMAKSDAKKLVGGEELGVPSFPLFLAMHKLGLGGTFKSISGWFYGLVGGFF
jgi:hypothetical protein